MSEHLHPTLTGPRQKSEEPTRHDVRRAQEREEAANERAVFKAVSVRDGYACRACGRSCDPQAKSMLEKAHHHHIVYRSALGPDTTANVCLLCAGCHDEEHVKRTLHVEGNADVGLTFSRKDAAGEWYVSKQETAVGVVEKD